MTIVIRNKNWSAFQYASGGGEGIRTPVLPVFGFASFLAVFTTILYLFFISAA
jgi:hypothetical protein